MTEAIPAIIAADRAREARATPASAVCSYCDGRGSVGIPGAPCPFCKISRLASTTPPASEARASTLHITGPIVGNAISGLDERQTTSVVTPASVPEGWVLVPERMTDEMIQEDIQAAEDMHEAQRAGGPISYWDALRICWSRVLSVAPVYPLATPASAPAAPPATPVAAMCVLMEEVGRYGLECATTGGLAPQRSLIDAVNAFSAALSRGGAEPLKLNKHIIFDALSRPAAQRTSMENVEDVIAAIESRPDLLSRGGDREDAERLPSPQTVSSLTEKPGHYAVAYLITVRFQGQGKAQTYASIVDHERHDDHTDEAWATRQVVPLCSLADAQATIDALRAQVAELEERAAFTLALCREAQDIALAEREQHRAQVAERDQVIAEARDRLQQCVTAIKADPFRVSLVFSAVDEAEKTIARVDSLKGTA